MLTPLLLFRSSVLRNAASDFAYIADFGFYSGGAVSVSWHSLADAIPLTMLLLESSSFTAWRTAHRASGDFHDCQAVPPAAANWSTLLTTTSQNATFSVQKTAVYYLIIAHCLPNLSAAYAVDARFFNPDDEHLDSRYVPVLTVLPIAIPLNILLLIAWLLILCRRKSRASAPRWFLCAVVGCQVLNLAVTEIDLALRSRSDSTEAVTNPVRVAVLSLFTVLFFSLLF
jgi:hypothetical protein